MSAHVVKASAKVPPTVTITMPNISDELKKQGQMIHTIALWESVATTERTMTREFDDLVNEIVRRQDNAQELINLTGDLSYRIQRVEDFIDASIQIAAAQRLIGGQRTGAVDKQVGTEREWMEWGRMIARIKDKNMKLRDLKKSAEDWLK